MHLNKGDKKCDREFHLKICLENFVRKIFIALRLKSYLMLVVNVMTHHQLQTDNEMTRPVYFSSGNELRKYS